MFETKQEMDSRLSKAGRRFVREVERYIDAKNPLVSREAMYEHFNLAANALMMPMYDRLRSADFDDPETQHRFEQYLERVLTHVTKHAGAAYAAHQASFNDRKHRRQQ